MSEERENKAIWDEVLGKLNLPPRSDSWKAMAQILDSEMPNRSKRRRWLWLLLLLLLIGVCNYRRLGFRSTGPNLTSATISSAGSGGQAAAGGQPSQGVALAHIGGRPGDRSSTPRAATITEWNPARTPVAPDTTAANPGDDSPGMADTAKQATAKLATAKQDTAKTAPAKPDTTSKKGTPAAKPGTPKKPNKAKDKYRGFAAAIGFNQFFPLGQQVTSDLNSSGTDGQLSDYLPIPQVRYYFNKKVYVQVEAQFNTPQYTSKNLALKNSVLTTDSSYVYNAANGTIQSYPVQTDSSAYIRKLFYFNVPVSVHYSPLKNVWIGAGLQYSKLTNGVALYQNERLANAVVNDSVELSKLEALKGSTLYSELKSHEFRLLFDANYQWKGFMFGLRYNQALSKFIDLKLGPSTVVQARNSSLQLYIRYTIWRQRSLKTKK